MTSLAGASACAAAACRLRQPFLVRDWQIAQSATRKPVKITVPGPLTIGDSVADDFYREPRSAARPSPTR